MEYYNPITELEWLYGIWKGEMKTEDIETQTSLKIEPIGKEILEFNHVLIQNNSNYQYEKNTLFYDKLTENLRLFSVHHEGYIELADIALKSKNAQVEIMSTFNKGFNLPPNMKIQKKWIFYKKTKQATFEVKMGNNEKIIVSAELTFFSKL